MKTFVYIDHFKGEVQPASWEALGLAKTFGTAVALVFGAGVDEVAKAAVEYGADEVLVADDASLTDYRAETYASTLSALASSLNPGLILFPTTTRTRELARLIRRHPPDLRRQIDRKNRLLWQARHGNHPRTRLPQAEP
ncbi:MAG: hypothetical protein HYU84_10070 [Chloroflexi bacterium]|nr:hypothetical protein [Chloroflexota bacterium]